MTSRRTRQLIAIVGAFILALNFVPNDAFAQSEQTEEVTVSSPATFAEALWILNTTIEGSAEKAEALKAMIILASTAEEARLSWFRARGDVSHFSETALAKWTLLANQEIEDSGTCLEAIEAWKHSPVQSKTSYKGYGKNGLDLFPSDKISRVS